MKLREHSSRSHIEIYGVDFELVVTNSIKRSSNTKHRIKRYGGGEVPGSYAAMAAWNKRNFAIFISYKNLTHANIAHEVFHTTHNIIEWIGDGFSKKHHEPSAYLCGYLTKLIYINLAKWRIKPLVR